MLGPPRSGKTSCIVIPSVVAAPGPVVLTSTKPDVMSATAATRSRLGRCWLYDPTGASSPPPAPGLAPLRWSPVTRSDVWERALAAAHAMTSTSTSGSSTGDSRHWDERAEALLAPLLHAAALAGTGMGTVLRWVNRRELDETAAILHRHASDMAADVLAGIAATDVRERSGIFSTVAGVLSTFNSTGALESASCPNFDPESFVTSRDTIYVCPPGTDQSRCAPLIVGLLEAVRDATYADRSRWPPVLFALDEMANIAPIRSLPAIVSEGGGQGLVTLACMQDLSQARSRWGDAADGFLSLFAHKVVMPGILDMRTLQLVSELAGTTEMRARQVTRGLWSLRGSTITTSMRTRSRLPVHSVAQGRKGQALHLNGADLSWVRLTPWYESRTFCQAMSVALNAQAAYEGARG